MKPVCRVVAALTILCLALACANGDARAQSGSVKTQSQLNTETNQTFPDNMANVITPFAVRQQQLDLIASMFGGAVTGGVTYPSAPLVVGDILYAPTTTSIGRLADVAVGSVMVSGGVGVAPLWSNAPTINGGPVTVNPTGGTANNAFVGNLNSNFGTFAGATQQAGNSIIDNDSTNAPLGAVAASQSQYGATASATVGNGYGYLGVATTLANTGVFYGAGVGGLCIANKTATGPTIFSGNGQCAGGIDQSVLKAGAEGYGSNFGREIDVGTASGITTPPKLEIGVTVSHLASAGKRASLTESAFNCSETFTLGWDHCYLISDAQGASPITATTIISGYLNLTGGSAPVGLSIFDFTAMGCSGGHILAVSTVFDINCAGVMVHGAVPWSLITSTPTTLAGYGITSPLPVAQGGTAAATANANNIFAGPSSGGAAAPGFRPLASADLPAGTGTVTSVTCGSGLSGGTITTTGTCAVVSAYITSGVPYTSAVNILAPGWKNVTSITLLANTNYEVWASLGFEHDTAQQSINSNISQIGAAMTIGTGNVVQPFDAGLINTFAGNGLFNQAQTSALPVGPMRFTCGATTCTCAASGPQDCGSGTGLVINLNGYCGGTGPCVGFGRLQARQIP
jgi:hypothetical protein